jgi:hypothetical protein
MTTIADMLRREIERSPETLTAIARATGILQPPLWRFVHEGVDPKLESAEKLLAYFGYVVKKKGQRTVKRRPSRPAAAGPRAKRGRRL